MRISKLVIVLTFALIGCRKTPVITAPAAAPTLVPGMFVNSAGSWWTPHGTGSFQLKVTGSGNAFNYEITDFPAPGPPTGPRGSSGSSPIDIPPWSPDWFIYVQDTRPTVYLWFFGSSNRLWYVAVKDKAIYPETVRVIDQKGALVSRSRAVPSDVILRLPPDLRKLFPPIEAEPKRPSI
jgi:hypothetical protein